MLMNKLTKVMEISQIQVSMSNQVQVGVILYYLLTKYHPVSAYTDYWPSTIKYPYNSSSRKAQFSQLDNFSFYNSFDESGTVNLS